MECLHLTAAHACGPLAAEAVEACGLTVVTRAGAGAEEVEAALATGRAPDACVVDGVADWDALLARWSDGHPLARVPVLVLAPDAPPGLRVGERGDRVEVRVCGPFDRALLGEGARRLAQAARRRVDRERASVRDRLAGLAERAPTGVVLLDRSGRLEWANGGARALLGLPAAGGLPDAPLGALLGEGGAAIPAVGALPAEGWRGRLRAGARMIEAWVTPEPAGAAAFLSEVPDRGASRRALQELAHELNNPLALVRAYLDIGLGLAGDGPVADALREAAAGTDRLRVLVREVPRLGADEPPAREAVRLEPVVRATVSLAEPALRRRAEVRVSLPALPPVFASEPRVGQVLLNLVLNAAQAMDPARAETNRLLITGELAADGRVCLEVADTGPGIPPHELDRVFEPGFTTRDHDGGSGLGLPIVRALVRGMGGDVEVSSRVGFGTRVRVFLPAADEPLSGAVPTEPSAPNRVPLLRARVLVVDDEPLVARALRRLLAPEHDVETAQGGDEVLDRLGAGEAYDLLLCDLMMPGMSGVELHAALAARHPAMTERMIFLTGGAQNRAAAVFLDQVPNPRLHKPFDAATLRGVVRQLLGRVGRFGD